MGMGIGIGMKRKNSPVLVYNLMSDGELGEDSTWKAVMSGAQHKLANLICLVDFNNRQTDGKTTAVL